MERGTSGELVPLVLARSIPHGAVPDWMFAFAFAIGLLVAWLYERSTPFPVSANQVIGALGIYALALFALILIPPVERLLLGARRRTEGVESRAALEFFRQGLAKTKGATGVLILISQFERRLTILADRAIAEKVPASEWQAVANAAAERLARGELFEAIDGALVAVGSRLKADFPRAEGQASELPDDVRGEP